MITELQGQDIPDAFRAEAPDLHLRNGEKNHASLWWSAVPVLDNVKVGCLGHFAADNPAGAERIIAAALQALQAHGCGLAIGPLDGNTWNFYRFATGGTGVPPFFLEPVNPSFYPEAFVAAGFESLATYSSSRLDLRLDSRDLSRVERRLAARGLVIRPIRLEDFRGELARLHDLSLVAFADNYLYTPIELEPFLRLYAPIEALVVPEFVLVAEADGEPVSLVFAVPDLLEQQRTGSVTTLVVKTLATHPSWRHLGVGSVLIGRVQAAARAAGFTHAIHALQHETNLSRKITERNQGERIREYTLFSRELE